MTKQAIIDLGFKVTGNHIHNTHWFEDFYREQFYKMVKNRRQYTKHQFLAVINNMQEEIYYNWMGEHSRAH